MWERRLRRCAKGDVDVGVAAAVICEGTGGGGDLRREQRQFAKGAASICGGGVDVGAEPSERDGRTNEKKKGRAFGRCAAQGKVGCS